MSAALPCPALPCPERECVCVCMACTDTAAASAAFFALKISGIGKCYAEAVGVNVLLPPEYGPDGKAIRMKF